MSAEQLPFTIEDLDEARNAAVVRAYSGGIGGFVQAGPQRWLLPNRYREEAAKLHGFAVRPDDIWITGYPRSGTTLTQDLLWLIAHDADVAALARTGMEDRVAYFEVHTTRSQGVGTRLAREADPAVVARLEEVNRSSAEQLERLAGAPSPRLIKTHLPFCLLPPAVLSGGCKVVYICRNVKDVLVSYHRLQSGRGTGREFAFDLRHFWTHFKDGMIFYTPYWAHVQQGWERRHSPNFKFIFYENLTKNLREHIVTLAEFLGRPLSAPAVAAIEGALQFDTYKQTNANHPNGDLFEIRANGNFTPSGKVNNWKAHFSKELNEEVEKWIAENAQRIGMGGEYPTNSK